jgi:hypothetical protein
MSRLVRLCIWLGLGAVAFYLVGMNLFLSTPLFGTVVNAQPDIIDIHYARAWSILPGKIHARDLSIRGRDGDVEWILRLDEVDFGVSFLAFTQRRFQANHVHGTGISFRLRQRLDAEPSSPAEVADLPPIEGLPPYSVRPPSKPSPGKWNDAKYDLWMAHLEDIVADDVRQVWIDRTRFEGSARIDGRFFFKPVRAVDAGPARVTVARGRVQTGDRSVAEALDGSSVDVTIAQFDPRIVGGIGILRFVSLDGDGHAYVPDVGLFAVLPPGISARGAAEVRRSALHLRSGVLERESYLEARAGELAVVGDRLRATGSLEVRADIAAGASGVDELLLRGEARNLLAFQGGERASSRQAFVRGTRLEATGDSRALDLTHPLDDLHLVVDLVGGDVPDARTLSSYIPSNTPVAFEGGRAHAKGRLEVWLAERRANGSADLSADDLDLRVAKLRIRGHTAIGVRFSDYHFDTQVVGQATAVLAESAASLATSTAPAVPLVFVNAVRVTMRGREVDVADPLRSLDATIAMPSADVAAPELLHAYLPKGPEERLVSGHSHFSLQAKLAVAHELARGTLAIDSVGLMLAYRGLRLNTEIHVRAAVHDWQWERGILALDEASIDVDHPAVTAVGPRAQTTLSFERIALTAASPHLYIPDPLARVTVSASLVRAMVPDPAGLAAFLPEELALDLESKHGRFDAEVRADVQEHVANGRLHVRALGMGIRSKKLALGGSIDLAAEVTGWDFATGRLDVTGSRATVTGVEGRLRSRSEPDFTAARVVLEVRARGFEPTNPTLRGGEFHLVVDDAVLPDARALDVLLPPNGAVLIESGTGRMSANLSVSDRTGTAAGTVGVSLLSAAVRLEGARLTGDFRLDAGLRGYSPGKGILGLSDARLQMRNVAVTGSPASTPAWRGDLAFSNGYLRLGPPTILEGRVTVDARDARPLLAVLIGEGLPGILVRVTDMPRLVGSARLTVGPDRLGVVDLTAGGGNVALQGSYAAIGHRRRGGVIARKCILSVGLRLEDDGVQLRLFGLDGWLRDRRRDVLQLLNEGEKEALPAR